MRGVRFFYIPIVFSFSVSPFFFFPFSPWDSQIRLGYIRRFFFSALPLLAHCHGPLTVGVHLIQAPI